LKGHKRRRSKDTWTLTVEAGRDPATGRRKQKFRTVRGTEREADTALARFVAEVDMGVDVEPSRLTVATYLGEWLDRQALKVEAGSLKRRTFERYRELVRLHANPAIGVIPLGKLRAVHVERAYQAARDKGLSERTVLHLHRVMFTALRDAVRLQYIARNVAESVEPPRPRTRDVEPLAVPTIPLILEAVAGTDLEVPTLIALGTGMRRGEVLGLRWKDLDLDAGTARLSQTLSDDGSFDVPKTHRSRTFHVPGFVITALRAKRRAQNERRLLCGAGWVDLDLVVDRGDGGPMRVTALSQRFRYAMTKAGIDLHFHALRHGNATLSLSAGIDLKVTSQRLGHSAIGITGDLYTHVADELDRRAAQKLDDLLAPIVSGALTNR
jgi:integrase